VAPRSATSAGGLVAVVLGLASLTYAEPVNGDPDAVPASDEFWRAFLTRGDSNERKVRQVFRRIPHGPRCKMCAAPFSGLGAPFMRMIGKRPSDKNPTMCNSCFEFMAKNHGGAEIECTFLFADVRGSTTIAEGMSATSFRALLDRFYATASTVVFDHDGSVDKFVGDELVAIFFPLLTGDRHAARAIETARALFRATGHADADGPWLPLGAGIHTGPAWVGAVGDDTHTELTALGDTVNTTARLASVAGAGEILVSTETAGAAGLEPGLEERSLQLKGKDRATSVVVLHG
jgi:adenylate cyclase